MKPMIIGLTGRARSGKTTAANHLRNEGMIKLSFAQPLKDMLLTLGLTSDEVYGDRKELPCDLLGSATPRWAMQSLGTEWGRKMIHEDIWVNAAMRKAASVLASLEMDDQMAVPRRFFGVVFDDVRFINEAQAIRKAGGYVYRITRLDAPEIATGAHDSERFIDELPVDGQIFNGGTVDDLLKAVDGMYWASRTDAKVAELGGGPLPNEPLLVRVTHAEAFVSPTDYSDTVRCAGSDLRGTVWIADVTWEDGKQHPLPPVGQMVDFHKPPFTNARKA